MKRSRLFFALLCVVLLTGCCVNYNLDSDVNPWIGFSTFGKDAFSGAYRWNGDSHNMQIVIPDEYKDFPVTRLGGYYGSGVPSPFDIVLPSEYCNKSIWSSPPEDTLSREQYKLQELVFDLYLGKNVKELELVLSNYYAYQHEDGTYTFTHPVFNVECSPENKTFYSESGMEHIGGTVIPTTCRL